MIYELGEDPLHASKCMRHGETPSGRVLHRLGVGPNLAIPNFRNPRIRIARCVVHRSKR
jgi:hypothetical protein